MDDIINALSDGTSAPVAGNVNEIRERLMNRKTEGWIVLHPHGKANPTDNYRVAQFSDWLDFANGKTIRCLFQTEHPTYAEAAVSRDKLNGVNE